MSDEEGEVVGEVERVSDERRSPITPVKYEDAPHGDDCTCPRCRGYQPGNTYGVRHGVYWKARLSERAAEIRAGLEPLIPGAGDADEPVVASLAVTLAQVEACSEALAQLNGVAPLGQFLDDRGKRLHQDARAWIRLAASLAEQLGLTPAARAKLGLEVAAAQKAQREALDLSRLDDDEVRALRGLVAKAEGQRAEEVGE